MAPQGGSGASPDTCDRPGTRVGWVFIASYAAAYLATSLVFIAPLLVTLALKIDSLVGTDRAGSSLSLVAVKAFLIDRVLTPQFTITPFIGWDAVLQASLVLLILGVVLAMATAFLTLRRYLRV